MPSHKGSSLHVCTVFHHNNRADRERLSGVLRYAATRPDWEVRMIDRSSPDTARDWAHVTDGWPVDGLVFTALGDYRRDIPLFAKPRIFKAKIDALEDDPNDDADVSVRIDADQFAEVTAELLYRRGFRTFGFYGTSARVECDYADMAARHFRTQARRLKVPCEVFHEPATDSLSAALHATAAWIRTLPKPCGILAYSDDLARNLIDACRLAKINVPEQIGIIGVDDALDICESTRPTLTSLLPDFHLGGYLAAELLDKALRRGRRGRCRTAKYGMARLVERASTQDLRNVGRIASLAAEYIRTAPLADLSAEAVAAKANVSRRLLEMHFRQVVGQGVHAAIRERRLLAIRDRLTQGSAPISDLVLACGFKTLNAAQVAFRQRFGKSMSELRRQALSVTSTPGRSRSLPGTCP